MRAQSMNFDEDKPLKSSSPHFTGATVQDLFIVEFVTLTALAQVPTW